MARPSCRRGGQVGGFGRGVPVGVDSDGVKVDAIQSPGVCRRAALQTYVAALPSAAVTVCRL